MAEAPRNSRIPAVLEQNRWFAALPAALKSALVTQGRIVEVARGQWLYGAGDALNGLYAVLDGGVDVMMSTITQEDVLVDIASAGRVFSQASGPRLVTVLANEDSRLLFVPDHVLREIARGHPDMWRSLTDLLYEQLSNALQLAVHMIRLPPKARVAARLLFLAGSDAGDGSAVHVTQSQLAELTGLSRKTVNGHLAALAKRNLIAPGYRGLVLRNLAGLRRAAGQPITT
jgi:CRP/FNR family transcriptional regulator, cyclic AMP receptor protein